MTVPEDIISDEEIIRVHAYANFGSMTPREVVNDGVRKYAVGYAGGSTQLAILREHGLITKPKVGSYRANLTEKGKRYARSIYHDLASLEVRILRAEVARLREALVPFCFFNPDDPCETAQDAWEMMYEDRFNDWIDFGDIEAARAALKGGAE